MKTNQSNLTNKLVKLLTLTVASILLIVSLIGCSAMKNANSWLNTDNLFPDNDDTNLPKIEIDPFEGIKCMVTGVSPYCTISINNAGCSENAQMYVEYTFDKEYYKNGDVATVTATFIQPNAGKRYELTSTTYAYTVENQAEYITSLTKSDMAAIELELSDYILAKEGSAGWWTTGYVISFMDVFFSDGEYNNGVRFQESDLGEFELVPQNTSYFSCLKAHNQGNREEDFNIFSVIYRVKFRGELTKHYICVKAENIVRDSHNNVKWGSEKNMDTFDFTFTATEGNLENAISMSIMSKSIDYNITKVEN